MGSVPVYDATSAFTRGLEPATIDISTVAKDFPLYKHELLDGDFVAVGHSLFFNEWNNQWSVKYGIYFAVLLAHESDAKKKKK